MVFAKGVAHLDGFVHGRGGRRAGCPFRRGLAYAHRFARDRAFRRCAGDEVHQGGTGRLGAYGTRPSAQLVSHLRVDRHGRADRDGRRRGHESPEPADARMGCGYLRVRGARPAREDASSPQAGRRAAQACGAVCGIWPQARHPRGAVHGGQPRLARGMRRGGAGLCGDFARDERHVLRGDAGVPHGS